MSETLITDDVLEKLNGMGDTYIYNDGDFTSSGEPQNIISGDDLLAQLSNYVNKYGDSMVGNLYCPTVQLNSIQFTDNTTQSTAVSSDDLNSVKLKTTGITYNSDTSGTFISNLTTNNFNTSFLSSISEDVQTALNTVKTKLTGVSYSNNQTVITNLNANTLTAGNFNTSHLSNTISNVQGQIDTLKTNLNNAILNTTNISYDVNFQSTTITNLFATNFNTTYLQNITSDVQQQFNTITSNLTTTINDLTTTNNNLTTTNNNLTTFNNNFTTITNDLQLQLINLSERASQVIVSGYTQTITIPNGVRWMDIVCIGGGGGAGASACRVLNKGNTNAGGSGGGGGGVSKIQLSTNNITSIVCYSGNGGAGGNMLGMNGLDGLDSYVKINNIRLCNAGGGKGGLFGNSDGGWDYGGGSVAGGYGNFANGGASGRGGGFAHIDGYDGQTEGTAGGAGAGACVRSAGGTITFGNGGNGGGMPAILNNQEITTVQGGGSGSLGFDERTGNYSIATQGKLIGFYSGSGGAGGGRYEVQSLAAPYVQGYGAGGSANGTNCSGTYIQTVNGNGANGSVIIQFYY